MNIQQLEYVQAVVDLKNFELAADKCCVTQSTLSTMIARLEKEIGIKIFNRKTKPVSITQEGEHLINRIKIILHELDSLQNLVQELKGEQTGEIRIGVIPTIAPYLLPLFLQEFALLYPKIKVRVKELTTFEIIDNLKKRNLDAGILALPINDPELNEISLYPEPFLAYDYSGNHSKKNMDIEDLDYSKLWLLEEGHCLRTQVSHICAISKQSKNKTNNLTFESGSMESLLRFTEASNGITIIPYLSTLEFTKKQNTHLIPFKSPVPVRNVGLITHKDFVKKQLLLSLKNLIIGATDKVLPDTQSPLAIKPL